jgi:hypothetical protein
MLDIVAGAANGKWSVWGSRAQRVFFQGTIQECVSYIRKARRYAQRVAREQSLKDLGLTKVRGALGGVYWE